MNQFRLTNLPVYAMLLTFFTSCGGGGRERTTTDTTITDSTATVDEVAARNTTITTPQGMMLVRHKVADFAKWKTSYEEHDSMRRANQVHSYVLGRGLEDSNMVFVAVKVDDMDKAKTFSKDPSLRKAMQKGGVVGAPTINLVNITFQDTATIRSEVRSSTMFTVKDWDAWEKSFKDGEQDRLDNGLAVRAYGHDADDNHKVTVVVAVLDSAKATAYWKSDKLKKRMEDAGLVGEPKRFLFRIVRRY